MFFIFTSFTRDFFEISENNKILESWNVIKENKVFFYASVLFSAVLWINNSLNGDYMSLATVQLILIIYSLLVLL